MSTAPHLPSRGRRRPARCGRRSRQRGVFGYLFAIATAAVMIVFAASAVGLVDRQASQRAEARRHLAEARAVVLAHLATPDPSGARRLGQPGRLFDLPVAAGPGADATEPDYDGTGEIPGRCAFRGWAPGQALQPVTSAAARCFGRLAWRDLGLVLPDTDPTDPSGRVPWVVVSPNLALASGCLSDLNPLLLGMTFASFDCTVHRNRPQFPWLRVVDARGRLLSDRVAVALVQPGPALPGQTRTATARPSAWLDRFTLQPGCAASCVAGTHANDDFDHADNQPTTLVAGPTDDAQASRPAAGYQQPLAFNDRIAWITIDELVAELERRVRAELLQALQAFRKVRGHYPYAAPLSAWDGACAAGLRFGHPAIVAGGCSADQSLEAFRLAAPWFGDGGWHRYYTYAVSDGCRPGNGACVAPGLVVGANVGVNALVIAPGTPIRTPPYAASLGAPQQPLAGTVLSGDARHYLDTVANATAMQGTPGAFVGTSSAPAPANDRLEILP